jgi:hypothetical protein
MNFRTVISGRVAVLILAAATTAFSQSQIASGDIKGTVKDSTGGVLPGATVTVTHVNTGIERTVMMDSIGDFRIFLLPPADYEVSSG